MSLAAAQAMDDLAEAFEDEQATAPAGTGFQIMGMMARAHRRTAAKIRARAEAQMGGPLPVPPEYRDRGSAGSKR